MNNIQKTITLNQNQYIELFANIKAKISRLAEDCLKIVITDDNSLEQGKELARRAKKIENFIEEKRKEATKPLLERKKMIDEFAKTLINELTLATKSLREQILFYEQEKERKRLEELRRIEEEKRRIQEELKRKEEELKKAQIEGDTTKQIEIIQQINTTKQEQIETQEETIGKSKNLREVWDFEIIDPNIVPREYLVVNETAIRKAIYAGIREIPGVRIFKKQQLYIK